MKNPTPFRRRLGYVQGLKCEGIGKELCPKLHRRVLGRTRGRLIFDSVRGCLSLILRSDSSGGRWGAGSATSVPYLLSVCTGEASKKHSFTFILLSDSEQVFLR